MSSDVFDIADAERLEQEHAQLAAIRKVGRPAEDAMYWRLQANKRMCEAAWVYYVIGLLTGGAAVPEHIRLGLGGDKAGSIEQDAASGVLDDLRFIYELLPASPETAKARLLAVGKRLRGSVRVLNEGLEIARQQALCRVVQVGAGANGKPERRIVHRWLTRSEWGLLSEDEKDGEYGDG